MNSRNNLGLAVGSHTNVGLNLNVPRPVAWRDVKTLTLPKNSPQAFLNSIFEMKLSTIKELDLSNCNNIETLDGIQNLKNLECLILDNTKVGLNITALRDNDKIKKLSHKFVYPDIDTITTLKNLEELDISSTDIEYEKLSELPKLSKLKKLNISNNEDDSVSDLSPIGLLTNLEELNISNISGLFEDDGEDDEEENYPLSDLSNLTKLKKLDMSQLNIGDISFIENLENLEELNIRDTPLYDISPLENLSKLKKIYMGKKNYKNFGKDLKDMLHGVEIIK
jgi:internalin A